MTHQSWGAAEPSAPRAFYILQKNFSVTCNETRLFSSNGRILWEGR